MTGVIPEIVEGALGMRDMDVSVRFCYNSANYSVSRGERWHFLT